MSQAAVSVKGGPVNGFRGQSTTPSSVNRTATSTTTTFTPSTSPKTSAGTQIIKSNTNPNVRGTTTTTNTAPPNYSNTTNGTIRPNPTTTTNPTTNTGERVRPNLNKSSYMSKSTPALANAVRQMAESTNPSTPSTPTPGSRPGLGPVRPCAPPASPRMPQGPGASVLATVTAKPSPGNRSPSSRNLAGPSHLAKSEPASSNQTKPEPTAQPKSEPTTTTPAPVQPKPEPTTPLNSSQTLNPTPTQTSTTTNPPSNSSNPTATQNLQKRTDQISARTPVVKPALTSAHVSGPLPARNQNPNTQNNSNPAAKDKMSAAVTTANLPKPGPTNGSNNNAPNHPAQPPKVNTPNTAQNPASRPTGNLAGNGTNTRPPFVQSNGNVAKPAPGANATTPLNNSNNTTTTPNSTTNSGNPSDGNLTSPRSHPMRMAPVAPSAGSIVIPTASPPINTPNNNNLNGPKKTPLSVSAPVVARQPRPGPVSALVGGGNTPPSNTTSVSAGAGARTPPVPKKQFTPFPTVQQPAEGVAITITPDDSVSDNTDTNNLSNSTSLRPTPSRPAPKPLGHSAPSPQHSPHQTSTALDIPGTADAEEEVPSSSPPGDYAESGLRKGTKKLPAVPQHHPMPPHLAGPPSRPARLVSAMTPSRSISEKAFSMAEKQELLRNRRPPPAPPVGESEGHEGEGGASGVAGGVVKSTRSHTMGPPPLNAMSMYTPGMGSPRSPGTAIQSSYVEVGGSLQRKTGAAGTRVFGVGLEELRIKSKIGIPIVLKKLLDGVENLGGFDQEGIFRIPGTETEKVHLRKQMDSGMFLISPDHSVHSVATLVKDWLRSLTTPIIPNSLYDKALENVAKPEDSLRIVDELPELNRSVLIYLIHFLRRLLEPEVMKKTRMDIENFATAFGPCFFIPPDDVNDNLEKLYSNLQSQKKFVANLLNQREEVVNMGGGGGEGGKTGISSKAKNLTRTVSTKFSKWQEMSMKKAAARRRVLSSKKQRISDAAKEEKEAKKVQDMLSQDQAEAETDGPGNQ